MPARLFLSCGPGLERETLAGSFFAFVSRRAARGLSSGGGSSGNSLPLPGSHPQGGLLAPGTGPGAARWRFSACVGVTSLLSAFFWAFSRPLAAGDTERRLRWKRWENN